MYDYASRLQHQLGETTGEVQIQRLFDFAFGPGLLGGKTKRKLLIQLLSAAVHDAQLHKQIQVMYRSLADIKVSRDSKRIER